MSIHGIMAAVGSKVLQLNHLVSSEESLIPLSVLTVPVVRVVLVHTKPTGGIVKYSSNLVRSARV